MKKIVEENKILLIADDKHFISLFNKKESNMKLFFETKEYKEKFSDSIKESITKYNVIVIQKNDVSRTEIKKIIKDIKRLSDDIEIIFILSYEQSIYKKNNHYRVFYNSESILNIKELFSTINRAFERVKNTLESKMFLKFNEFSLKINSEIKLEKIPELVCKAAVDVFRVDHSGLVLFEKDQISGKTIAEFPKQKRRSLDTFIQVKGIAIEEDLVYRKKIICVPDVEKDSSTGEIGIILSKFGIKSVLIVPVVLNGRTIASFSLDMTRYKRNFYYREIELCKRLADQVAIALSKTRLLREISILNEISQEIGSIISTDTVEICKIVKKQLNRLMPVKNFYIALYDKQYGYYHIPYSVDEKDNLDKYNIKKSRKNININEDLRKGLTEYVRINNKPIKVTEEECNKLISEGKIKLIGSPAKVWMGTPLKTKNEFLGVIAIQNYDNENTFDDRDLENFITISFYVALVLQNAMMLSNERYLRTKTERLFEITSSNYGGFGVKETADKLLVEISELQPYKKATVQLVESLDRNRQILALRGFGEDKIDNKLLRPIVEDELISEIVLRKEPLIIENTEAYKKWTYYPSTKDVRSWIGIPLIYHDKIIGLITLDHSKPDFYKNKIEDQRLLTQFGKDASFKIHNALANKNYIEKPKTIKPIDAMIESINEIIEPHELLKKIVSEITNLLDCKRCSIFESEMKGNEEYLLPKASVGWGKNTCQREFRPDEGIVGLVYKEKEKIQLDDALKHPKFLTSKKSKKSIRSLLCFPIKVGDKVTAIICADHNRKNWFKGSQLFFVEMLAHHIGVAIERTRGLDILHKITSQITSIEDEKDILKSVVKGAIQLTRTTSGILYLLNDDKLSEYSYQFPQNSYHPTPRMGNKNGLTRTIIKKGRTIPIPDIRKDKRVNPELKNMYNALIACPLKIENKVIGILFLNDKVTHNFTPAEKSFLETLTGQAAIAIHNASELKRIDKVAQSATRLIVIGNYQETLDKIVNGILETSKCDVVTLYTYDAKKQIMSPPKYAGLLNNPGKIRSRILDQNSIVFKVIVRNEHFKIINTNDDLDFKHTRFNREENIKSAFTIPLIVKEEKVGVLFVNYRREHILTEYERKTSQFFADLASVAIFNAQLFEVSNQKRLDLLKSLYEAGLAVTSSIELKDILNEITKQACKIVENHGEQKYLSYIAIREEYILKIKSSFPEDFLTELGENDNIKLIDGKFKGIIGYAVNTGEPQLEGDVTKVPYYIPFSPTTKSELAVPIKIDKKVIGVINVEHPELNVFDEEDRKAMEALATQAAIAINNSILIQLKHEKELVDLRSIMLSTASHEFNTPLQSILLSAEELQRYSIKMNEEEKNTLLTKIIKSTNHMTELMKAVLNIGKMFSLKEGLVKVKVNIYELCISIINNLQISKVILNNAKINFISKNLPISVEIDVTKVTHILENLLINAGKYSPVEKDILFFAGYSNDTLEFIIEDEGIGIDKEELEHIFEPFYRAKNAKDIYGTGLGMTIVKNYVDLMQGQIRVVSELNKGTKVIINIPIQ